MPLAALVILVLLAAQSSVATAHAEAGNKVNCSSDYDAFNQMQTAQAGSNDNWAYRHDALGRRCVEWNAAGGETFEGTRFIYDGYSVIQERKFTEYVIGEEGAYETIFPSTSDPHSKAHKIFVRGSLLFSAVDGDLDGYIGADSGADLTTVNKPEYEEDLEGGDHAYEAQVTDRNDFAYYYLDNAGGQVMALLARDNFEMAEEETVSKSRILEYYKYNAFGSMTVLPAFDRGSADTLVTSDAYDVSGDDYASGGKEGWDLLEDTPLDLQDNNALMYDRRQGNNNHVARGEGYGREGVWGNE